MIKNLILILILASIVSGCQKNREMYGLSDVRMMERKDAGNSATPLSPLPKVVIKKQIIKDGTISFEVQDLSLAKAKIDSIVKNMNAYYDSEVFSNEYYYANYNLKIRIPCDNFERFILELEKGEAKISEKQINARDVTEEFFDLETRLTNKRSYLKRYSELLSKAKVIEDIMGIEEKMRVLEEEINSSEGRMKFLNDQVAYSTLEVKINQIKVVEAPPTKRTAFMVQLQASLSGGWFIFVDFCLFLIKIWPFWILALALIPLIQKWRKRKKAQSK